MFFFLVFQYYYIDPTITHIKNKNYMDSVDLMVLIRHALYRFCHSILGQRWDIENIILHIASFLYVGYFL